MPNDLQYFHEKDLNHTFAIFRGSLPTQELKNKVEASLRGNTFLPSNVLQGYRGPHTDGSSGDSGYLGPNNGLQEVRYWWGPTKHFNWVPFYGQLVYGALRAISDTSWHSIYFDSKTGECLSHDKETAASKLNTIGVNLFENGKFHEAVEYFSNAYAHSSNSTNYNQYKENRDKAQHEIDAINLNSEGDHLFGKGQYAEARAKFQAAYDKSNVSKQNEVYARNRDRAQAEIDTLHLNSVGDTLFNQGKYAEAGAKYQAAYNKSNGSKQYEMYKSNRDKAQAEADAIKLNYEGDKLFNEGKYVEAKAKYEAACSVSNISKHCKIYAENLDRAQAEIDTLKLSSEFEGMFVKAQGRRQAPCEMGNMPVETMAQETYREC